MPNISLTDTNINETYVGLLHAQGATMPLLGQVRLYDGSGKQSSIAVGINSNGMTVSGLLSADTVTTPVVNAVAVNSPTTAKAWVNFSGSSALNEQTINTAFNITKVMRYLDSTSTYYYTATIAPGTLVSTSYTYSLTFAQSKTNNTSVVYAFVDTVAAPTVNSITMCFRRFAVGGSVITNFDPDNATLVIYSY